MGDDGTPRQNEAATVQKKNKDPPVKRHAVQGIRL